MEKTQFNKMHHPIVGSLLLLLAGCSSVPVQDSGQAGLFQSPRADRKMIVEAPSIPIKSTEGFSWPLRTGSISSFYGSRRRDFHDGIDIRARKGTPVYSAKAGEVIYSARRIRGYGNMIVIRHENGFSTVYAHNSKNLVKLGDSVKDGQKIALVGRTGRATGPHLHFEVRRGQLAEDPLSYLPKVDRVMAGR
ncbi:MAG: M23 family metallopeptidase [Bacteriovoracia bacterium]